MRFAGKFSFEQLSYRASYPGLTHDLLLYLCRSHPTKNDVLMITWSSYHFKSVHEVITSPVPKLQFLLNLSGLTHESGPFLFHSRLVWERRRDAGLLGATHCDRSHASLQALPPRSDQQSTPSAVAFNQGLLVSQRITRGLISSGLGLRAKLRERRDVLQSVSHKTEIVVGKVSFLGAEGLNQITAAVLDFNKRAHFAAGRRQADSSGLG